IERIGAIVTTSTTPHRWRVARPPRLVETPAGVLAAGPWPNPGLNRVLERYAPVWATWRTPVLLSVVCEKPSDFAALAAALEGVEGTAGLELTRAAPAERAAAIAAATRAATLLPLLAKLPPLEAWLAELARTVARAGADAITACAGPRGLAIDPHSGERLEG